MPTPNTAFRAARLSLRMSQDELARALQAAAQRIGETTAPSKRLVQRWEDGTIAAPRPAHARLIEMVIGVPVEALGFAAVPGARVTGNEAGHNVEGSGLMGAPAPRTAAAHGPVGTYSGVWLSRYEYYSSSRDGVYAGLHHVVILQHGDRLTVRSLPEGSSNPDSILTIDLTIDGNVATGTWVEQTSSQGYYRGARYHGAIQLLIDPSGRRMAGKWVGFGKDMDVNTGPWTLSFQDASTTKATLDRYSQPPVEPAA